MTGQRRKMPTKLAVRRFWAPRLCKRVYRFKFDSAAECLEADYCFACGFVAKTERAHINARFKGGPDTVANLHLLCGACHRASEHLEGRAYLRWFCRGGNWMSSMIEMMRECEELKTDARALGLQWP